MKSINPATGGVIREYKEHTPRETNQIIEQVQKAWISWKEVPFAERSKLLNKTATILRNRKTEWATLMTSEMGKIIRESQAEIEKCAVGCDFFASHAQKLLEDEVVISDAGRSLVTFQPLGIILAVMPWNFPFWQVFRFAAPTLMAGNAAVLKHASNVPGCALAIEKIFRLAGFPEDLFRTLMIPSSQVEAVIEHPLVRAATLTGSEYAGSQVASQAGKHIKKTVLELGGSDPFIVLEDADLDLAISVGTTARMINQGQSCIAAKRFILHHKIAGAFTAGMKDALTSLKLGDPMDPETQVGPLARTDLVDDIDRQVHQSIEKGAVLVTGGVRPKHSGCYYMPTILTGVRKGMAAYHEETFGPLVSIIIVQNEDEAIAIANDSEFGLGGSVFTRDLQRGERIARRIETGAMFVNGLTKSDPRLPFGGIKKSGYGRELAEYGIKEFVNIKSIWIK
jgi:succinate-semialdehyde dehydrogenase/glutarate-semialdehyde dehydrogenase